MRPRLSSVTSASNAQTRACNWARRAGSSGMVDLLAIEVDVGGQDATDAIVTPDGTERQSGRGAPTAALANVCRHVAGPCASPSGRPGFARRARPCTSLLFSPLASRPSSLTSRVWPLDTRPIRAASGHP